MAMYGSQGGKIYVVFKGRIPGFYYSWFECQVQVDGFSGSLYQRFRTKKEAISTWNRYGDLLNMRAPGVDDGTRPGEVIGAVPEGGAREAVEHHVRSEPIELASANNGIMFVVTTVATLVVVFSFFIWSFSGK
ncbi:Ribosomal protein L9/RNase H1, N-terminal [Sesbania bispinosa]|nr:Ribosomal protein L9/RNase H1, N-terminal [Sesbania bispinosa]